MGELGDYWREHRDYLKSHGISRSRPRPRATIMKFRKSWEKLGFRKCSDWHWQMKIGEDLLDFWPSKLKWRFRGETTVGTELELIAAIKSAKDPAS